MIKPGDLVQPVNNPWGMIGLVLSVDPEMDSAGVLWAGSLHIGDELIRELMHIEPSQSTKVDDSENLD